MVETSAAEVPFVSVIIPVYNDPEGLKDTLEALAKQDYPRQRWEAIVADNNSTNGTLRVAEAYIHKLPKLKMLVAFRRGSYAARNRGIEAAQGDILAFIDADMTVGKSWIGRGATYLSSTDSDYVGCRIEIYSQSDPPTMWELFNQRTGFNIKECMEQYGFSPTACLFVKRSVVERVGDFDERLVSGGDIEFGHRVRSAGLRMAYDDGNLMRHRARATMHSFWDKFTRVSRGRADLSYFYPDRYGEILAGGRIVRLVMPVFLLSRLMKASDLRLKQKVGLCFVAYFQRFAMLYGLISRYLQIKRGLHASTHSKQILDNFDISRTGAQMGKQEK